MLEFCSHLLLLRLQVWQLPPGSDIDLYCRSYRPRGYGLGEKIDEWDRFTANSSYRLYLEGDGYVMRYRTVKGLYGGVDELHSSIPVRRIYRYDNNFHYFLSLEGRLLRNPIRQSTAVTEVECPAVVRDYCDDLVLTEEGTLYQPSLNKYLSTPHQVLQMVKLYYGLVVLWQTLDVGVYCWTTSAWHTVPGPFYAVRDHVEADRRYGRAKDDQCAVLLTAQGIRLYLRPLDFLSGGIRNHDGL